MMSANVSVSQRHVTLAVAVPAGLTLTVSPATRCRYCGGLAPSGQSDNGVAIRFRQGASGAPRDRDAWRPGARWAPRDRRLLRVLELRRRLQRFLRRSRQDDLALLQLEIAHRHRDLMLSDAEESADSDDRV